MILYHGSFMEIAKPKYCMSDVYLAEELGQEYAEKTVPNGNDS